MVKSISGSLPWSRIEIYTPMPGSEDVSMTLRLRLRFRLRNSAWVRVRVLLRV